MVLTTTTSSLIGVLRQTRLLTADQLEAVNEALHGRLPNIRRLGRLLVQMGWLTIYQMQQLLAGNGAQLALGPYHVLDLLGQGGQSTVYHARHSETRTEVALKVIRGDLLDQGAAPRQFLKEMEAMARLNHPNIVRVLDADCFEANCYCALEYVTGTDLARYIRLVGPLPPFEASDYVRQAALGLQHAHEHNLIHRDIKPANLFHAVVTKGSRTGSLVKILDWGLAKLVRPGSAPRGGDSTERKAIIGTADYLSPEQAFDPRSVDIRGDIYSLGCTFYFLLTGQPPFPEGTVMQKVLKHRQEEPRSLEQLRPNLPLGLSAIVQRMLAKRPEDRFQTPGSVAVALAPFCHSDRFLLPRLNRENRHRLGLDAGEATPCPTNAPTDEDTSIEET